MPRPYTGSIEDIKSLRAYLDDVMVWIKELQVRYDLS